MDAQDAAADGPETPLPWPDPRIGLLGSAARLEAPLTRAGLPVATLAGDAPLPPATRVLVGPTAAVASRCAGAGTPIGVGLAGPEERPEPRAGIAYLLRTPVDEAALVLLLGHLLQGGAERRWSRRATLEARVRLAAPWLPRRARLVELSLTGAVIEGAPAVPAGGRVWLRLPRGLGGGRARWVPARALRSEDHVSGARLSIAFSWLSPGLLARLRAILEGAGSDPGRARAAGPRVGPEGPSAVERRGAARRVLRRHLIARGAERPRVLIGRDVSLGGMRVDPAADLVLGAELDVALHARAGAVPLVLHARVERDDGERGLFLRFPALDRAQRDYLDGMLSQLPALETSGGEGVIVSEVLGTGRAA